MKVELIYEKTCPNINAAREQLIKALNQANAPLKWLEWEVSEDETPDYARHYGSPTILVNERDVVGESPAENPDCCRIYSDENGRSSGVPKLADIVAAISQTVAPAKTSQSWKMNTSVLPVIGLAFVPKLFCPACWPAYAGLLSAFGIGFIDYTPYLLPLSLIFVLIALAALAYKAPDRQGYMPFALGVASSVILIVGKFYFDSDFWMYIGLGLLITASIWNTWPLKSQQSDIACSQCTTGKK